MSIFSDVSQWLHGRWRPPATAHKVVVSTAPDTRTPPADVPDADAPDAAELVIAEILDLRAVAIDPKEEALLDRACDAVRRELTLARPELVSFPAIAFRVVALLEEPNISIDRLVSTIGQDAAVSAALLRVANSAYYARGIEVGNVRTAVTHIGFATVAALAAGIAGRALYDDEVAAEYAQEKSRWDDLFHRSMTAAFAAGALAMQLGRGGADRAFAGGMFHDVGKTMALRSLIALQRRGELDFTLSPRMIDRLLDRLHVPLGVEMAREWKLPEYVARICAHHHDSELPATPEFREAHIVRLVAALNALRIAPDLDSPYAAEVRQSIAALRLERSAFLQLSSDVRDFAAKVTAIFGCRDSADVAENEAAA